MNIIPILAALFLIAGLALLVYWFLSKKNLGTLTTKIVYKDSENTPGEVLFSKTLALCGKPDYIIKEGKMLLPIEVKSSRTPGEPYQNHEMQLMAYCLLVEENYGIRPTGGIIKYPEKEFKIAYTNEAKESIKDLVGEMLLIKHSNRAPRCPHPEHNR